MKQTDDFVFFWNGPFSNWYPSRFSMKTPYGPKTFNCSEQAMMYYKAMMFGDEATAKLIMKSTSPREQKALGRQVKNFNKQKWDNQCVPIVTEIVKAKFASDIDLFVTLMETEEREIVEASPVDEIWGVGLAEDNPNILDKTKWRGKNYLGICLMNARKQLKEEQNVT